LIPSAVPDLRPADGEDLFSTHFIRFTKKNSQVNSFPGKHLYSKLINEVVKIKRIYLKVLTSVVTK
jgi:hypothetical protein